MFDGFCQCFNDADFVYVADVYEAGETPIENINGPALCDGIRAHGHRNVENTSKDTIAADLKPQLEPDDLVVFLGAGDITYWAAGLADQLAKA